MKNIKVGIPKALIFYEYYDLWIDYFREIGVEVITSEETNKTIIEKGIENSNSEYCLPLKVFMGHVESLVNKVDYIFVPRYTSIDENEFTCPKFCALPDLVRLDIKLPIKVIEAEINLHYKPQNLLSTLVEMSSELGVSSFTSIYSFKKAAEQHNNRGKMRLSNDELIKKYKHSNAAKPILILGHQYMVNDKCISMDLLKKVYDFDYEIITPENIDRTQLRKFAEPYNKDNFWSVGIENLGAAFYCAHNNFISGAIFITPFACGIDSIVSEIIEMRYEKMYGIPFLKLTVDEHSGEAGFNTRLEAFFDNLDSKNKNVKKTSDTKDDMVQEAI
jgi:predicted nucleotide-binding protein (sugar kinase/HSP70/actin superfamily)